MSLTRMFHHSCDVAYSSLARYGCEQEMGDQWYSWQARQDALDAGWHISGEFSICGTCWGAGIRFAALREASPHR